MLLQSDTIFLKILESLAILLLLLQLFGGITYLRRGHFSNVNTLQVTGLFVLSISMFFIIFNRINLLWLMLLSWIISAAIARIIIQQPIWLLWAVHPLRLLITWLFKLYTLGVSPRKIWFVQTVDYYEAGTSIFQVESSPAKLKFIDFTDLILSKETTWGVFNNLVSTNPSLSLSSFTPGIILFLIGSFEKFYGEPVDPSNELRFQSYVQDLNFSLNLALRGTVFKSLEKYIGAIIFNLYFIHLENDMSKKISYLRGKDRDNAYLFNDPEDMRDYFKGKKIAEDWLEGCPSVQSDFCELVTTWANNIEIDPLEAKIIKFIRWFKWR